MIFPWFRKKADKKADVPSLAAARSMVDSVLVSLGADISDDSLRADSDGRYSVFEYQGGTFVVDLDDLPFVKIVMPRIFRAEVSMLKDMRLLCAEFNGRGTVVKAMLTVNDKDPNTLKIDLIASLTVSGKSTTMRDIDAAVTALFEARNGFGNMLNEYNRLRNESEPFDYQMDTLHFLTKLEAVRAMELFHGSDDNSQRPPLESDDCDAVSLARYLEAAYNVAPSAIGKAMVVTSDNRRFEMTPEQLTDTPVVALLFPAEPDGQKLKLIDWAMIYVEHEAVANSRLPGQITLTLTDRGDNGRRHFVKLTSTDLGQEAMMGTAVDSPDVMPRTVSTLLCAGHDENARLLAEYNYMLDDAREKMASGNADNLEATQLLLLQSFVSHSGYHLYHGANHFYAGRYFQALVYLRNAYTDMVRHALKMDDDAKEAFYEVCFMIGVSYMHLGNPERAYFFLSMVMNNGNLIHDRAFINCMIAARDPRSLNIVETVYKEVTEYLRENKVEGGAPIAGMRDYVVRRYIYLLIENGRLADAEELLTAMMQSGNADDNDFALAELAHIRRLRNNN